mmetsp:Transcript_26338/g.77307  ORF Transcript_26338/g.77307 Transcript_26338/m.77307 type:complete len:244 (-) Transcript_26338:1855-2586(-)
MESSDTRSRGAVPLSSSSSGGSSSTTGSARAHSPPQTRRLRGLSPGGGTPGSPCGATGANLPPYWPLTTLRLPPGWFGGKPRLPGLCGPRGVPGGLGDVGGSTSGWPRPTRESSISRNSKREARSCQYHAGMRVLVICVLIACTRRVRSDARQSRSNGAVSNARMHAMSASTTGRGMGWRGEHLPVRARRLQHSELCLASTDHALSTWLARCRIEQPRNRPPRRTSSHAATAAGSPSVAATSH